MSSVNGVNSAHTDQTAASGTKSPSLSSTADVSKSEFLQLLVAQLQNQDPTNPAKNEDFIAQLATFSSLEQLMSINEGVTTLVDATQQASSAADAESQKNV